MNIAQITAALVALALAVTPAFAQEQAPELDVQHFQPNGDRLGWFVTHSADTLELWQPAFGLWFSYGRNPFAYYRDDDRVETVVSDLATLDLQGAVGFGPADLAVDVPIHLFVGGDGRSAWGGAVDGSAFGDLRLIPKVRLLDSAEHPVGLAVVAPFTLPTGNSERFAGLGTVSFSPMLAVSGRTGMFRLGANVGARIAGREEYDGHSQGPAFLFRLAASVHPHPVVDVGAEIYGDVHGDVRSNPTEWLLGATFHPVEQLGITIAGGTAIGPGVGSPEGRLVFSVGNVPLTLKDADEDGIVDRDDDCPEMPEDIDGFEDEDGCPEADNDADGILDASDACPNVAENFDGWKDTDGCPEDIPDTDGDGMFDNVDECINHPEDMDGFEDGDGCPDNDNDGDGILDNADACPDQAEVYNNVDDEDGCPDEGRVVLDKEEIRILEKVYFDTNKAVIKTKSHALLDDVAALMQRFENIRMIEVQGHTDSRGNASYNLRLSEARAKAVMAYLTGKGVASSRLTAIGYGEAEPVDPAETDEAHAKNRRVQFVILQQD